MVNNTTEKSLTVYKANAGTGKTFTLACEYMKLVISNPQSYRGILAVTFTNKATQEMKTRILSQLYGIWKGLADSNSYKDKIIRETGLGEALVRKNAGIALGNLLHNYGYFRVQTIDTFFQSVLRNLARELDLAPNLRIELNDDQVEEQAVDELIESLSSANKIFSLIMDFVNDSISDDKGWNVIGEIKKFGRNIFKDFYKQNHGKLETISKKKDFFSNYKARLYAIRKSSEDELKAVSDKFFNTLQASGCSIDDFSRGRTGVCGYFVKLAEGKYTDKDLLTSTLTAAMDDSAKWLRASDNKPGKPLYELVNNTLIPLLIEAEKRRKLLYRTFKSADLTLRHMYQLQLLGSIEAKVHEMNSDANRFLLSDTQSLLHVMIKDSDAPFIFEKIGSQLEHIMIDEFQDTSVVQWNNFKVLLKECMSHVNAENLIVGDVKQSIYRWRDSDWRLLNDIEKQFPEPERQLTIKSLKKNYRSERNIIDFNDEFFIHAAKAEYQRLNDDGCKNAEELEKAYSDVEREPNDDRPKKGLVQINLYCNADSILESLKQNIERLHEQGVEYAKMAILVRSKSDLQTIADFFLYKCSDIPLVSNEAFRLDSSPSVLVLVSALRYLSNPNDELEAAFLKEKNVPDNFFDAAGEMLEMPFYDLVEHLYNVLGLYENRSEGAYLCAFFDQLKKFLQDNTPDIEGFLEAWDENICGKTIQSGEVEGIQLLTIHKSKGLEFDNVFIPFCDWKLEQRSIIWCENADKPAPFNELPIVPIDYSAKQMKGTIYENDYLNEHLQNTVDNLNLLYVAFTRASKNLFVSGLRGKKNSRQLVLERVLTDVATSLNASFAGNLANKEEDVEFSYGKLDASHKAEKVSQNIFLRRSEPIVDVNIDNFDSHVAVWQQNESRQFVEDDGEESDRNRFIKRGNILHSIFSRIRTVDDIAPILKQMEFQGVIYDEEITHGELERMLKRGLENPIVGQWFKPGWQLFNECQIIFSDPISGKTETRRPDRVMSDGKQTIVVDFKFGKPMEKYKAQVSLYITLLKSMGYENVRGYLWYVMSNRVEEVK